MPSLFRSRDPIHRSPFGAVTPDTTILLRVRLPRDWSCSGCRLCVDNDDLPSHADGMFWAGMDGDDFEWWDCRFTPPLVGLYWYCFALDLRMGRRYLVPNINGDGVLADKPDACWQITCYAADFVTPDWLAGGVMYQIFPDRFRRSKQPKADVPADRTLHEEWNEQVNWLPNTHGVICNDDYFGGDLRGIKQKLPYLAGLGVTCLYLNPIFEAHSNHRYNTADYHRIDPLLGTEEDFRSLCADAARYGIRLLLDGVFSHTGSDSRYFNRERRYPNEGAYNSPASPYASWYQFRVWPNDYASWWGFITLPEVQETNPSFMNFINGEDGVVQHWLRGGASGWRLDVADELPDPFLDALREAAKKQNPDALVLGEVWEDASSKQSYGHRRRYLLGKQLDSVMNYPFCNAILDFVRGGGSDVFFRVVCSILENYPPQVTRLLMNHIGTHDTERALTLLAGDPVQGRGRRWQAETTLSDEQRQRGLRLLRLASALQFCVPGVPCIYYGDEAGMEGYRDPFNRGTYPWGHEEPTLLSWYRRMGRLRRDCEALREGEFLPIDAADDVVCFERRGDVSALICAVNRSGSEREIALSPVWQHERVQIGSGIMRGGKLVVPPLSCAILTRDG